MAAPIPTQRASVDEEVMIKNFLDRLDSKKSTENAPFKGNSINQGKIVASNHASPLSSVTNFSHPVPNLTAVDKPVPESKASEIASRQPSMHVSSTATRAWFPNSADGTSTRSDAAIAESEHHSVRVPENGDTPFNKAKPVFDNRPAQLQKETSQLRADTSVFVPTIRGSKPPHENVFYSPTRAPFTLRSNPLVDQYVETDVRTPIVDTLHNEIPYEEYLNLGRRELARIRQAKVDKQIAINEAKRQAKAIASLSEVSASESISEVNIRPIPTTTVPGPVSYQMTDNTTTLPFDKSPGEAQLPTLPGALSGNYELFNYGPARSGGNWNGHIGNGYQENLKLTVNSKAVLAADLPSESSKDSAVGKASLVLRQIPETKMVATADNMTSAAGKTLNQTLPVQPKDFEPVVKQHKENISPGETTKRMMEASSDTTQSPDLTVTRGAEVITKEDSIINRASVGSVKISSPDVTQPSVTLKGRGFTNEKIDREHQVYFEAWGKPEARNLGPARVRRVVLRNLPTNHTAYTVASLVYGGALEQIQYTPESATASVLFLDADDCLSYYNKTSNGIELPGDSLRVIWVELAKQVEPVSSMVRTYVERECSRCVRAIGIDDDMSIASIMKLAKAKGRTVEHITIKSTADGVQTAELHFCDIKDAVTFKAQIDRDENWEACNIQHFADPCGTADGVHN